MPSSLGSPLLNHADFPVRWYCGIWTTSRGSVAFGADLAIAACAAITLALAIVWFCRVKRRELAFPELFWLFAIFLFSCGVTHLMEAVVVDYPSQRSAVLMKVITAAASWATVIAILRVAPKALGTPGLRQLNRQLQQQLVMNEQTRAALERSNRDLQDFTEVVTHDLRNTMSGALLMAEMAKESATAGDAGSSRDRIEVVLSSLRQMDEFVKELHSEALAKEQPHPLSLVPLGTIVNKALTRLEPVLRSSQATVTCGDLPLVDGNSPLLVQLFCNLIENAVKYKSEHPPQIRIEAQVREKQVDVRVTDNGRGITDAEKDFVFEHAARAGNSAGVVGSGIGLALCRRIMHEHHGSIQLDTDSEKGAAFILVFPRTPPN
ncbi:HAMP domain-containing histidine kinase [bacterium]|nr:HAMP domain-containing histidine kinase [bacterium]